MTKQTKCLIIVLSVIAIIGVCKAAELSEILYGVNGSVEVLSNVNRLRDQVLQTNAKQKANNVQTIDQTQNVSQNSQSYEQNLYPVYYPEVELYGYELPNGTQAIEPRFKDARPFSEGLAPVYNGYRWGYINQNGGYVLNPKFGGYEVWEKVMINPFVNGTVAVYRGAGNVQGFTSGNIGGREFALIDKKGNVLKEFDDLYPSWYGSEGGKLGEYHAALDGKGYIVDSKGNILKQEY